MDGVVYFAQSIPGAPIKIGISRDPHRRVRGMKCPLTRAPVKVIATLAGHRGTELQLHDQFRSRRLAFGSEGGRRRLGKGQQPEWFAPCPELVDFIRTVCRKPF